MFVSLNACKSISFSSLKRHSKAIRDLAHLELAAQKSTQLTSVAAIIVARFLLSGDALSVCSRSARTQSNQRLASSFLLQIGRAHV